MLQTRMKKEMGKMLKMVMESVYNTDNMALETKYLVDRVDRMYVRIKQDVGRHETLCFELADKFWRSSQNATSVLE